MRRLLLTALLLAGCETVASVAPSIGIVAPEQTVWLGIEYAQAERWQLPEHGPDWNPVGTYQDMGPECPQKNQAEMVEDCLFLNVFAPNDAADLPVLVWIHGGGFVSNGGGDYVKSLTRDGIVAVSFNYRLGKLGFFDWAGWSEDDPRNFAQADMVMALQWVQANIEQFGGDPDRVTIMGHSAGGMGVQLMMVDPRARGLFDQAIAHSGYAAWPFPKAYNPSDEERMRIRYAPLPLDISPEELVDSVTGFYLPYRGGSDLADQPLQLFRDGASAPVPYLAGANSHDGLGTLQGGGFTTSAFLSAYADIPAVQALYADDFAVSDDLAAERLFGDMRYLYSSRETAVAHAAAAHSAPSHLFLLDAPGTGRNHTAHYKELFGDDPSNFRSMIVDFIKTGDHEAFPNASLESGQKIGWLVLKPDNSIGSDAGLDERLNVLDNLEFPQP